MVKILSMVEMFSSLSHMIIFLVMWAIGLYTFGVPYLSHAIHVSLHVPIAVLCLFPFC